MRWKELSSRDQLRVATFAALLPGISVALRLLGYKRTRAWLERAFRPPLQPRPVTAAWVQQGEHLAGLARMGARFTPANTSCLRQALLLHTLLRRQGLPTDIQFGVDAQRGTLDLHAWVEMDGQPLGQPGLRHARFERDG